jgi:hypothetical protein
VPEDDKVYALKSGGGICLSCMCGLHQSCRRPPGMDPGQCRCALESHPTPSPGENAYYDNGRVEGAHGG